MRSQINYREAAGQLTKAQADTLRLQQPHVVAKMLADIDQSQAAAAQLRFAVRRGETLLPLEERKTQADIEREQAATSLSKAQENRIGSLLKYEQQQMQANINRDNAAAGLSAVNENRIKSLLPGELAQQQAQLKEYVDMEYTTDEGKKQQFKVRGPELINAIEKKRDQIIATYKAHQLRIKEARADKVKMLNESTKAEQNLIGKRPGGYADMKDERDLVPDADMFHATSTKPFLYILEQGDPGLGLASPGYKMNKRDLPKVDGHQYTAAEIWDAADKMGLTVQQYMEQVFYPKLQQPVPWRTGETSTVKPAVK